MVIYKESGKLRAEVYKNIGYFFGSIFSLMVINVFVYKEDFLVYLNWRGLFAIISLGLAYYCIGIGVNILRNIDKQSSENHDNL